MMSANGSPYYQLPVVGVDINTFSAVTHLHFGSTATPLCNALTTGLIGWNGTALCNGSPTSLTFGSTTIPLSSTPPTTSQVLKFDGTNIVGAQADIQASSITLSSGNVTVPANTNTTVLTKSVTMPASVCPCRVFGGYGMYLQSSASGIAIGWITDGTNNFATSQALVTGSSSNYGANGTSFSPTTYANNAAVAFTLTIEASNSRSINLLQQSNLGASPPQSTWMNITVQPSN